MKYVCPICGYVYDEEKEGVPFSSLSEDWKCPICGADKAIFEADNKTEMNKDVQLEENAPLDKIDDLEKVSIGEFAAICSNLARGCEKQYMVKEASLYKELANYFDSIMPQVENATVENLSKKLEEDIASYSVLKDVASKANDRGALRVCTWGDKVTRMLSNLVKRYLKEGEAMLENTNIWVCSVCGFVYIGENAPELCPVCKVPSWKFDKVLGGTK